MANAQLADAIRCRRTKWTQMKQFDSLTHTFHYSHSEHFPFCFVCDAVWTRIHAFTEIALCNFKNRRRNETTTKNKSSETRAIQQSAEGEKPLLAINADTLMTSKMPCQS